MQRPLWLEILLSHIPINSQITLKNETHDMPNRKLITQEGFPNTRHRKHFHTLVIQLHENNVHWQQYHS